MKIMTGFLLICLSAAVNAQVYKCIDKQGRINYQAKPCQTEWKEKHLPISSDPAKEAQGKIMMQKLEAEYDDNKAKEQREETQAAQPYYQTPQQPANQMQPGSSYPARQQ